SLLQTSTEGFTVFETELKLIRAVRAGSSSGCKGLCGVVVNFVRCRLCSGLSASPGPGRRSGSFRCLAWLRQQWHRAEKQNRKARKPPIANIEYPCFRCAEYCQRCR